MKMIIMHCQATLAKLSALLEVFEPKYEALNEAATFGKRNVLKILSHASEWSLKWCLYGGDDGIIVISLAI